MVKKALELSAKLLELKADDILKHWGASSEQKQFAESCKIAACYLREISSQQKDEVI